MLALIWIIPLLLAVLWIVRFTQVSLQFDKILFKIYQRSKDDWIKLGRPLGNFWVPKEASTFSMSSTCNRGNLGYAWSIDPPIVYKLVDLTEFSDDLLKYRRLSSQYKKCYKALIVSILLCCLVSILSQRFG